MLIPRRTQLFAAYGRTLIVALAIAIAMLVAPRSYADSAAPETSAVGVHGMVVSESDDAAHAGVEILKHGGNAVDAALATELAVGVTNPAACGIGGGGFMLIYMAKAHRFYALDYRETAPLQARPDMYMRNGKPDEDLARDGILGVGVPGEIAGIDAALRRFGTMKFQQIAAPAEKLAADGYVASPHLAKEIEMLAPKLKTRSWARPGFPQTRRLRAQCRRHDRRKEPGGDAQRPRRQPGREFLSRRGRSGAGRVHEGAWRTGQRRRPCQLSARLARSDSSSLRGLRRLCDAAAVVGRRRARDARRARLGPSRRSRRQFAAVPGAADRSDAAGLHRSRAIRRPSHLSACKFRSS